MTAPRRFLLVNPNTNRATTDTMVRIARAAAPDGVTIEGATAMQGAPLIVDEAMLAIAAGAVETLLRATDLSPFDGVIIAAFGDPGLAACREVSPVPVIGIAEAAMAEAAACGRFAIVTTTPLLVDALTRRVEQYGHADRFLGSWLTRGDTATLMADPARLEAAIGALVEEVIATASPDAVIIGGGPLAAAASALRPRFSAPLIEPVPAALRLALARAEARGRS